MVITDSPINIENYRILISVTVMQKLSKITSNQNQYEYMINSSQCGTKH